MGLGLWTSEEVKHDPESGEILTKNTWVREFVLECKLDFCANRITSHLHQKTSPKISE